MSDGSLKRSATTHQRATGALKRLRAHGSGVSSSSSARRHDLLGSHGGARSSQAPAVTSLGDIDVEALIQGSSLGAGPAASSSAGSTPSVAPGTLPPLDHDMLEDIVNSPFVPSQPQAKGDAASLLQGIVAMDTSQNGMDADGAGAAAAAKPAKRKRSMLTKFPILRWLNLQEVYLREMLRHDGRGDALHLTKCPSCGREGQPDYRCGMCRGADMCKDCILHWHKYAPFHDIYRYDGDFYRPVSASDMGTRIQLMHPAGETCPFRDIKTVKNFTVVHTNGIHHVHLDYCSCEIGEDVPWDIQLMRWRLWPATTKDPHTATTFEALDEFSRLQLLARVNAYDYHRSLEAASDGAGVKGLADVRQQFSLCAREFAHIMLFKRAGRGHEEGGIAETPLGGCAIRCPACPVLGVMIPEDWESSPWSWLYRIILSMDANFRLSNKLTKSTNQSDPCLTQGKAYMAAAKDYGDHCDQMEEERVVLEPPGDCSQFGAVNMANMKGGKGVRTTGVAGIFCARHEFWLPSGLATLRKGERYSTMDYIFCGALTFIRAPQVLLCYDIACQWYKKLFQRLRKIPGGRLIYAGAQSVLSAFGGVTLFFAVPKFHLPAHIKPCQLNFALGRTRGTGATDGEASERVWAGANPAASSLREMGPGSMHDAMDNLCGSWNWRKVCGLANLLCKRMKRGLKEGSEQCAIHTEFTGAVEEEDKAIKDDFEGRVEHWEEDPTAENPYALEDTHMSVKQIELEAAQAVGSATDDAAAGAMVEEEAAFAQWMVRVLKFDADRVRVNTKQGMVSETLTMATTKTKLLNNLVRDAKDIRAAQKELMPLVYASLTAEERNPTRDNILAMKLRLPSEFPRDDPIVPEIARKMEGRIRWAGMSDELKDLLHQLRLRGCLNRFKIRNITGQRANVQARTAQDSVDRNVKKAANAYRRHRIAYLALVGEDKTGWEAKMQVLEDSDCRGLGDRLIEQMANMSVNAAKLFLAGRRGPSTTGEGGYKLPWIWYKTSGLTACLEITDELMVEWCKSRARAQRWVEEVMLVQEEMRRALVFNEHEAGVWDNRRYADIALEDGASSSWAAAVRLKLLEKDRPEWDGDEAWADGLRAYACKQAWIRREQASVWNAKFAPLRLKAEAFLRDHTMKGLCATPVVPLPADEAAKFLSVSPVDVGGNEEEDGDEGDGDEGDDEEGDGDEGDGDEVEEGGDVQMEDIDGED